MIQGCVQRGDAGTDTTFWCRHAYIYGPIMPALKGYLEMPGLCIIDLPLVKTIESIVT